MDSIFTEEFDTLIQYARDEAMRTGHYGILPEHILLAIVRNKSNGARRTLVDLGADPADIKQVTNAAVFRDEPVPYQDLPLVRLTEAATNVISAAVANARVYGSEKAGAVHLLMALGCPAGSLCREILTKAGVTRGRIAESARRNGYLPEPGEAAAGVPSPELSASDIADALEAEIRKAIKADSILTTIAN